MEEEKRENGAEEQLVVFQLAGETYGIDISTVHEIIRMQAITDVPRTPDFVEGVINLRGRIVPVIDLHKRFGLVSGEKEKEDSKIMVVEVNNVIVGMIVDSVTEVLRLPTKNIEPPPAVISTGVDAAYLRGVGKWKDDLIILLNLDKIFQKEEQKELQESMEEVEELAQ